MKLLLAMILVIVFIAVGLAGLYLNDREEVSEVKSSIYASWNTTEFDKCVAIWLISRFVDKDAEFVFYPSGSEIAEGILFDIPGERWSRQHRKCTSQCILEDSNISDSVVERIVSFAAKVELNFWQLEQWPDVQGYFTDIKQITDNNKNSTECYEKTNLYFDDLYEKLKTEK